MATEAVDFKQMSASLSSLSTDWDVRTAALKTIQKAVDDVPAAELYEGLLLIAKPLAIQVGLHKHLLAVFFFFFF